MKSLNEALLERRVDAQYATLSLVSWNARSRIFTVVSAGSLPPMLCRKGEISSARTEGVPIGLLDDQEYEQIQIAAAPNDLLLLCSDGVEDQLAPEVSVLNAPAKAVETESYGRRRLQKVVQAQCRRTPQEIAEKIFEDIDAFRGATPLTDDQTIVALRVL
jgi:serine phosphatase RsbU (regulator of sigma subunit)